MCNKNYQVRPRNNYNIFNVNAICFNQIPHIKVLIDTVLFIFIDVQGFIESVTHLVKVKSEAHKLKNKVTEADRVIQESGNEVSTYQP